MTLRYLLDTSVVSSPISKVPNADIVAHLESNSYECAIASPVWPELTYVCLRLPHGRGRAALETYLQDVVLALFPMLAYDEPAAHWHGRERARLDGLGRPAPYVDGQIAAIAAVNDLVLVTVNVQDFVRFTGIVVENWSERHG